jgi:hypothetical protein
LVGEGSLAVPTLSSQEDEAHQRNIVIKGDRVVTGEAVGGRSDNGLLGRETKNAHVYKTSHHCSKDEGKDIHDHFSFS